MRRCALASVLLLACSRGPDEPEPPAITVLGDAPCQGICVDRTITPLERTHTQSWYAQSVRDVRAVFGPSFVPPNVVICTTEACVAKHCPLGRSQADMAPTPTIKVIAGGDRMPLIITHEMTHIAIDVKQLASTRELPAWLNEGIATYVGKSGRCTDDAAPVVDDLRRLVTTRQWWEAASTPGKVDLVYCQVEREIQAWVARRGDPSALLDLVAQRR